MQRKNATSKSINDLFYFILNNRFTSEDEDYNELEEFKNIKSIPDQAFFQCNNLTEKVLLNSKNMEYSNYMEYNKNIDISIFTIILKNVIFIGSFET